MRPSRQVLLTCEWMARARAQTITKMSLVVTFSSRRDWALRCHSSNRPASARRCKKKCGALVHACVVRSAMIRQVVDMGTASEFRLQPLPGLRGRLRLIQGNWRFPCKDVFGQHGAIRTAAANRC